MKILEWAHFQLGDAVAFAGQNLEAEAVEEEDLTACRDHLCLVNDQTCNCVCLVVGQVPFVCAVQVADGHRAIDEELAVAVSFDDMVGQRVEFIGDLAHDFFEDVFERDKTLQRPVLIHHQREVGAAVQELAQQASDLSAEAAELIPRAIAEAEADVRSDDAGLAEAIPTDAPAA